MKQFQWADKIIDEKVLKEIIEFYRDEIAIELTYFLENSNVGDRFTTKIYPASNIFLKRIK